MQVLPATITDIFDQIKGKSKVEVPFVQANGSAALPPSSVLEELYMIAPNAAFFTTVTTPTFEDVSHPINNRVEKYPELLTNFQDSDIFDITEKCNNIFQSYKVSKYQAENLLTTCPRKRPSSGEFSMKMNVDRHIPVIKHTNI